MKEFYSMDDTTNLRRQSCHWASVHQVVSRALNSTAPNRRCRSELRPGPRELTGIRAC